MRWWEKSEDRAGVAADLYRLYRDAGRPIGMGRCSRAAHCTCPQGWRSLRGTARPSRNRRKGDVRVRIIDAVRNENALGRRPTVRSTARLASVTLPQAKHHVAALLEMGLLSATKRAGADLLEVRGES